MFLVDSYNKIIFIATRYLNWKITWYGYQKGKRVCGFVKSNNIFDEIIKLRQIDIQNIKFIPDSKLARKIFNKDSQIVFFGQLQQLLIAGNPIIASLEICSTSNTPPYFQFIFNDLTTKVKSGISLHKALKEFPEFFDSVTIGLVKVGEESGTLNKTLEVINNNYKKRHDYKNKIIVAMRYPIIILIISVIIIIFFLLEIVPSFAHIFLEMSIEIPSTTKKLLQMSSFIRDNKEIVIISSMLFLVNYYCYPFKKSYKKTFRMEALIPKLAYLNFQKNIALTLSFMLEANIVMTECLMTILKNEQCPKNKRKIAIVMNAINNGDSFPDACNLAKIFDNTIIMQLLIAEKTGNIAQILYGIAENLEKCLELKFEYYCQLIQPIIIVIVGMIIGFILFILYTPIISAPLSL